MWWLVSNLWELIHKQTIKISIGERKHLIPCAWSSFAPICQQYWFREESKDFMQVSLRLRELKLSYNPSILGVSFRFFPFEANGYSHNYLWCTSVLNSRVKKLAESWIAVSSLVGIIDTTCLIPYISRDQSVHPCSLFPIPWSRLGYPKKSHILRIR